MKKISEKIDLSKMVLDIDIDSPVFEDMLDDVNEEIQRCIQKVYDGDFEAGEISLKLTIELPDALKEIPKVNEYGEIINELYKYKKPRFEHKITTTMKKQFKQEGIFTGEREVEFVDGKFITIPIEEQQMKMKV